MNGDGLLPEPWVTLSLVDGAVVLDGEALATVGTIEDGYLEALRRIGDEVAVPLGRPVGVRVEDNGRVNNLAVYPDGRAEAISDLVAAAASAAAVATPSVVTAATSVLATGTAGGASTTASSAATGRSWTGRSVGLVATAALATAVAAVGLTAVFSNEDAAESSALRAGRVPASAPAPLMEPVIAMAQPLEARPVLRALVRPHGPCALSIRLRSTQPATVTLRIRPADGPVVTRQVRLRGDTRRLVLADLPPGRASYRVISPEALGTRGRVLIMPLPPTAAAAAAVSATVTTTTTVSAGSTTSPASTGGSGGSGSGGGGAPVVPIDPDD